MDPKASILTQTPLGAGRGAVRVKIEALWVSKPQLSVKRLGELLGGPEGPFEANDPA